MKYKRLIFSLLLVTMCATATAQDTVSGVTLKDGYFWNVWPDFAQESIRMNNGWYLARHYKESGVLLVSEGDTLDVYGLAVSVETLDMSIGVTYAYDPVNDSLYPVPDSTTYLRNLNSMCDTSAYEEAYEFWGLYKRVADSLQRVSPQIPINVKLDTPTYYIDFGTYTNGRYTEKTKVLPVFEVFFRQPVKVADSFYVGRTNRMFHLGDNCGKDYYTWPSLTRVILPFTQMNLRQGFAYYQSSVAGGGGPLWVFGDISGLSFCFPILTPPDSNYLWDTTVVAADSTTVGRDTVVAGDTVIVCDTMIVCDTAIVGGDTIVYYDTIIQYDTLLALPERGLLGRMVGVMPNPAAETAKVVSSFGLTAVEVFNTAGDCIHTLRLPDAPLTVTLDVRRWPAGTYLLRIRTPQGTTVRKLTISH